MMPPKWFLVVVAIAVVAIAGAVLKRWVETRRRHSPRPFRPLRPPTPTATATSTTATTPTRRGWFGWVLGGVGALVMVFLVRGCWSWSTSRAVATSNFCIPTVDGTYIVTAPVGSRSCRVPYPAGTKGEPQGPIFIWDPAGRPYIDAPGMTVEIPEQPWIQIQSRALKPVIVTFSR